MGSLSKLMRSAGAVSLLSLALRLLSLFTQSRLAALLGAEGVGLSQLAFAAEALAVTLATSGIRYSAARLLSEELGRREGGSVKPVLLACVRYSLAFSLFSALAMLLLAEPLAAFSGDARIAPSLRVLSLALPSLSLNAVLGGYFTAVGRPWRSVLSQVLEQIVSTLLILLFLPRVLDRGLAVSCAALGAATAAADLASLLFSLLLLRRDWRLLPPDRRDGPAADLRGRLLRLSLPLAMSSYARTVFSTLRHMLVPKALRRSGVRAGRALEVYGVVGGMALPVLGFASVFFTALAELMIPELTRAQVRDQRDRLDAASGGVLRSCLLLSSAVALCLWLLGPLLGDFLYRSREAGEYIRVLAPLVVVMYMDTVVDGMLKGLGLQLDSMLINTADALLTLLGVWLLLPRYGIPAYIGLLYLSDCFNFLLSLLRLRRCVRIKLL